MGRPLNSKFFGTGDDALVVRFNNGTSVVDGYVIKQLGCKRFRVSDGSVVADCLLHPSATSNADLTEGYCVFLADTLDGTEYVRRITANQLLTTTGTTAAWPGVTSAAVGRAKLLRRGGAFTPPTPIAVSNFRDGVYSINGVTKSISDLWHQDIDKWGRFVGVTPGAGITPNLTYPVHNNGPLATAELLAALDLNTGVTVVLDATITFDANETTGMICEWDFYTLSEFGAQPGYWGDSYRGVYVNQINDAFSGPDYQPVVIFDNNGDLSGELQNNAGTHRTAFTLSETKIALATDGGMVTSFEPEPIISPLTQLGFWVSNNTGGNDTLAADPTKAWPVIHSITIYAAQPDTALLPLSAK